MDLELVPWCADWNCLLEGTGVSFSRPHSLSWAGNGDFQPNGPIDT